ncbi:MAG: hypothetical protein M3N54_13200 [Acidobacteriota bacterium]|nr:hypothetical protein [Acidobacteriota bacterium]
MTPSLFDLPLRIADAAVLAGILIDCAGAQGTPVTPAIRTRVAARLAAVKFASLRPFAPSLERDPTHPSALYICVDGVDGPAAAAAGSAGLNAFERPVFERGADRSYAGGLLRKWF